MRNKIKALEPTNTIKKVNQEDVRMFTMMKSKEAPMSDVSLKTLPRNLGIVKNQMYAKRKPTSELITGTRYTMSL